MLFNKSRFFAITLLTIPTGISTKQTKAEIEIYLGTVEGKTSRFQYNLIRANLLSFLPINSFWFISSVKLSFVSTLFFNLNSLLMFFSENFDMSIDSYSLNIS